MACFENAGALEQGKPGRHPNRRNSLASGDILPFPS
jgi:hypothetical protein